MIVKLAVLGLLSFVFCNLVSIASSQLIWRGDDSRQVSTLPTDAELYWERVIEAKGGRKKLHSLENIVVSSDGQSPGGPQGNPIQIEDLYVFSANKWWSWDDSRPSVFGLRMKMYDWKKGTQYSVTKDGEPFTGVKPIDVPKSVPGFPGLVDILVESRWDKPIPQRLFKDKVDGTVTIQTSLNGNRVDFVVDSKTMLPYRVIAYSESSKSTTRLSEYVDIKGIKFPTKVVFEGGERNFEYKRSYDFNVEYNEAIFETPPPFSLGRKAWMERP